MNLYELLFELIDAHVPVDPKRFNGLRQKAQDWYFRVVNNQPHPEGESNPPAAVSDFIKKYGELWYVQIALAVAFIPLNKWMHGLMHPDDDGEIIENV